MNEPIYIYIYINRIPKMAVLARRSKLALVYPLVFLPFWEPRCA
jgi:hypothetical protein